MPQRPFLLSRRALSAISGSAVKNLHCGKPQKASPEVSSDSREAKISTNRLFFSRENDARRQHYVGRRRALGMSSFGFQGQIAGASIRTPTPESQVLAGN